MLQQQALLPFSVALRLMLQQYDAFASNAAHGMLVKAVTKMIKGNVS